MKYLFSTENYAYLVSELRVLRGKQVDRTSLDLLRGGLTKKIFPDEEIYHKINTDVSGHDIFLIGGTINDTETMELYDISCGVVEQGARSLSIIIPYFGYSTAERVVKPGEVVKAKTRAKLLSSIPHGDIRNHFYFVDLHSEGIPYYFEGSAQTTHIYAKPLVIKICEEIKREKNYPTFVLGSTDAGRAKWVESLSKDMGVECAIITKRRISGVETEISGINCDVKGKAVIIYDDMIRTGSSIKKAAKVYKEAGATEVFVIATHGVLPESHEGFCPLDSANELALDQNIERIYVTNTHPRTQSLKGLYWRHIIEDFYRIESIAPVILSEILK